MHNKNYVVAGGSYGIGLALVEHLLAEGAQVHVLSRTRGQLPNKPTITHHPCDFLSDACETLKLPDSIHGAVYCPGSINLRSFRSLKLSDFRNDFELNVIGAVKFLKACIPGLKKAGMDSPSSVVLFSTVAVGTGLSMHSSIAAAKGAIEGLTRALAAEFAPQVRVNCIAPALTETPLSAALLSSEEKKKTMAAKYPLGRIGQANDIANAALFLLQPRSDWMTGQVIGVDGGFSTTKS